MTTDIGRLLERPEGETIDFKATGYDLSDDRKKRDFAKDLASLANTPREEEAYIVLGVKKRRDGSFQLWGTEEAQDDADLQSVASSLLESIPRFIHQAVPYGGVVLGLITIFTGQETPIVPKTTEDSGFVKDTVYFRRGSKNDAASMQEQGRIWRWLRDGIVTGVSSNPYALEPAWDRYIARTDGLKSSGRHILIVDDRCREDADELLGIGSGPWTCVFDFDPRSDEDGLLASMRETVEEHRALHIRVKGDPHTSRSPEYTTTWFFVRGLEGRADSMTDGGTRGWRRAYRQALSEECERLAGELTPATVYVTILWRDGEFNDHLAEVLRSLDDSLYDSFQPVFVTDAPAACESLAEEFDAPIIEMPLYQFAHGIQQTIEREQANGHGIPSLPSASGVPVQLEPQVANWIAEEIEVVPLGLPTSSDIGAFLRGGTVTWVDLDRNIDARRDIQTRLTEAVRSDLNAGRITRVNLFHLPGAGGTTVGRRVAWELHEEFPCGLLRRTTPMETADRIARIHELTERSVLLIADGTDIAEQELDELAEYLGARRTPVVIVQVRRRQTSPPQLGDRSFNLISELSSREVGRFVNTLSRDTPDRTDEIELLSETENRALHRPVYFALTAYERDFRALPDFVSSRIAGLDSEQTRAIVYAAIALRYGQRSLPLSALRDIFGLSPTNPIDFPALLPPTTEELFVETSPGMWRIGHSLVADELLQQILSAGGDPRTWRNRLADWGINFITFCRGNLPVPSYEMIDMARRVFLYRDDIDVLGREQSGQRRFSHFIQDVPISEGRVRVLDALVEAYPDEYHFWSHLSRFHAMERKDFTRALEAADHAVGLSDRDSVVYHMRGMVRKIQLDDLQRSSASLDILVETAEKASGDFVKSRMLNPENEHGYISEAQMLIDLLEYIARLQGDLFQFLTRRDVPSYIRDALDRVESLLAHVKREREGIGASQYETRASARVHSLYGDYSSAIQRLDSLTTRQDIYQPPIRRQLAWVYLARSEGDWSLVPQRNLNRVVELLARNLEEEPRHDQNIRLWMQASRFQQSPPSVEVVFEQVQYWRADPGSVDAAYYAYVLNALMAMDGPSLALQRYEQYLEECRDLTRFRRNRDRSYEWLGSGEGIARLVHQSRLGNWDQDRGFWENPRPLARVRGRVARINGPQAGFIELEGGLEAFFVPARSGLSRGHENTRVISYLGFSYDGLRAWDISRDV
ncbi:MAG: ATP-binding protein [Acidobacteriia bacterium]|nr:ATP-binding protein [Terriglobia bacterium]